MVIQHFINNLTHEYRSKNTNPSYKVLITIKTGRCALCSASANVAFQLYNFVPTLGAR